MAIEGNRMNRPLWLKNLTTKSKPALIAAGLTGAVVAGGATAWLLQRQPAVEGLPAGAEAVPQDAIMTMTFSTDRTQWRQLRQYGTPASQKSFDQQLANWQAQFFTQNGLNYQRDVQPWIAEEATIAFLSPPGTQNAQPDPNLAAEQSAVVILPIGNPAKAQELLANPQVSSTQEWVDREYKGVKIREVQGQTERAYAAAVLDNRFVVLSNDDRSVERAIDSFQSKKSIVQAPGYSQAFDQLPKDDAFMRLYVNLPAASAAATVNANQPVPPQFLSFLQQNQGLAATLRLEREGVKMQGITWLPANSPIRYKAASEPNRLPNLLPADTVLMTAGDNFKQFWQDYGKQSEKNPRAWLLSPDAVRQNVQDIAGMDFDRDFASWMGGEFSLALVSSPQSVSQSVSQAAPGSSPAASASPNPTNSPAVNSPTPASPVPASPATPPAAGMVLLMQASDRRAADQSLKKLDEALKQRYQFSISESQLAGKPVVKWVSPYLSLQATRGWLDGNVMFLAIGSGVAESIVPTPPASLATKPLFQPTQAANLSRTESNSLNNSGYFFMEVERLLNPNINLPLPLLPAENRNSLSAIRAIGVTNAVQSDRDLRFEVNVLLRSGSAPGQLPPPTLKPAGITPPAPAPAASPSP